MSVLWVNREDHVEFLKLFIWRRGKETILYSFICNIKPINNFMDDYKDCNIIRGRIKKSKTC